MAILTVLSVIARDNVNNFTGTFKSSSVFQFYSFNTVWRYSLL